MNKLNKKGQALVEFVLILPIILLIIFVVIDFANVFYNKNALEGTMDDVVLLINSNNEYKINSTIDEDTRYYLINEGVVEKVLLEKEITLITPFANVFFDNPYTIKTERVIMSE